MARPSDADNRIIRRDRTETDRGPERYRRGQLLAARDDLRWSLFPTERIELLIGSLPIRLRLFGCGATGESEENG